MGNCFYKRLQYFFNRVIFRSYRETNHRNIFFIIEYGLIVKIVPIKYMTQSLFFSIKNVMFVFKVNPKSYGQIEIFLNPFNKTN